MLRSGLFAVSLVLAAVAAVHADPDPKPLKVPKELLEKRLEAARKVFEQNLARVKNGIVLPNPADVFAAMSKACKCWHIAAQLWVIRSAGNRRRLR